MNRSLLTATVKDSKFIWHDKFAILAAAKQFEGKEISVLIEEKSDYKTYLQVKYWWGVVVPIVRMGYRDTGLDLTKDGAHYKLLEEIAKQPIIDQTTGEILGYYVERLSGMSVRRTMELIEQAQRFGAEHLGVMIPDPDPDYKTKRVKEAA